MSKLLKKVIDKHMPHLSSKLTAANGYDEVKHRTVKDLHKAKVIDDKEKAAIDNCIDDLSALNDDTVSSNMAKALQAADTGEINPDSLNDDEFIKSLMADLPPVDGEDDKADSDADIVA